MEMKTEMLITGELKVTATYSASGEIVIPGASAPSDILRAFEDASREAMTKAYFQASRYDLAPSAPAPAEAKPAEEKKANGVIDRAQAAKLTKPVAKTPGKGVLGPVGLGRRRPEPAPIPAEILPPAPPVVES